MGLHYSTKCAPAWQIHEDSIEVLGVVVRLEYMREVLQQWHAPKAAAFMLGYKQSGGGSSASASGPPVPVEPGPPSSAPASRPSVPAEPGPPSSASAYGRLPEAVPAGADMDHVDHVLEPTAEGNSPAMQWHANGEL